MQGAYILCYFLAGAGPVVKLLNAIKANTKLRKRKNVACAIFIQWNNADFCNIVKQHCYGNFGDEITSFLRNIEAFKIDKFKRAKCREKVL